MTLRVLFDGAKNGAEIMDAIESMTRGRWRPSPGSVYPMLEDLASERAIHKRDDGRYELTEQTRAEFGMWGPAHGEARGVDTMLRELEGYATYFEEISKTKKAEWAAAKPRVKALATRLVRLAEQGE